MASGSLGSTTNRSGIRHMVEHRLYSIERFVEHPRVKTAGYIEEKLLLCTPACATMYALKGYTIFDYHRSLNMEPEYYSEAIEHEL